MTMQIIKRQWRNYKFNFTRAILGLRVSFYKSQKPYKKWLWTSNCKIDDFGVSGVATMHIRLWLFRFQYAHTKFRWYRYPVK